MDTAEPSSELPSWSRRQILVPAAFIVLATLLLHAPRFFASRLIFDDVGMLSDSWPWDVTWRNLWQPANEHAMPLGRITTALLVDLAGRQTNLPFVTSLHGPIALLICLWLVFLFVRREMGHPFYGLIAMGIFGVTSAYVRCVSWYAASFALLSLIFNLLALLAAQKFRNTGNWLALGLCVIFCALAPAWFAIGVLAGPLCVGYLLINWIGPFRDENVVHLQSYSPPTLRPNFWLALLPMIGTVVFLAISIPRTYETIMTLAHYRGSKATDVFDLNLGIFRSYRSLVDHKLFGTFGTWGFAIPLAIFPLLFLLVIAIGLYWWKRAPKRSMLILGLGFIFSSDFLIQSARAAWDYDTQVVKWTRYQLYPHLGLTFFLISILPRWENRLLNNNPTIFQSHSTSWLILLTLMVLIQLPKALPLQDEYALEHDQPSKLALIETVDQRAKQHHISRETAIKALSGEDITKPAFRFLTSLDNAWLLLRGSENPKPISREKAREILTSGLTIP